MPDPLTCAQTLDLLTAASAGRAVADTSSFEELRRRQAVGGSPAQPQVTPIGQHVLQELRLRSYRCATWPVDTLSEELSKVLREIETIARNAQYFLSDLGPITPAEALPYLRIVSVGLANRRETPEEVAERFRNVWGMVEVMGSDARDRLLAAELLTGARVPMDSLYTPMVTVAEELKALGANRPVAAAALLQMGNPAPPPKQALADWKGARQSVPTDEAAALLARVRTDASAGRTFDSARAAFESAGGLGGKISASVYLAAVGADAATTAPRATEVAKILPKTLRRPLLGGALLAAAQPLAPPELLDWLVKASAAAQRCQLASQPPEFDALGIALVEGLPTDTFRGVPRASHPMSPLGEAATLLALHAWIYRPLLDPAFEQEMPAAARAA